MLYIKIFVMVDHTKFYLLHQFSLDSKRIIPELATKLKTITMPKSFIITMFACILIPLLMHAQDIEYSDFFGSYTGENAEGYCQPLADMLGASFNSGNFHHVKAKKLGFELYIDLIGTMAFVPEKNQTFTATPEGDFTPKTPRDVPTIVGEANITRVTGDHGLGYVYPGGYNISYWPLIYPQLTIGSVYGTQFVFRFFKSNIKDYGDVGYAIYGINHAVGEWIPALPLDLSVGFHYHTYGVIDSLSGEGFILMAKANYDWKWFSFYGGLAFESTNTNIKYRPGETFIEPISLDLKGNNSIRIAVGTMINLGPYKIFADYSLASQSVLTVGMGFAINEKRKQKE